MAEKHLILVHSASVGRAIWLNPEHIVGFRDLGPERSRVVITLTTGEKLYIRTPLKEFLRKLDNAKVTVID